MLPSIQFQQQPVCVGKVLFVPTIFNGTPAFRFAGSEHQGQITVIKEGSKYQINDGKYTYPIQQQHILGKVK